MAARAPSASLTALLFPSWRRYWPVAVGTRHTSTGSVATWERSCPSKPGTPRSNAAAIGVFYDFHHLKKPAFIFEGSVHYAKPVSTSGGVESNLWAGGVNLLWSPRSMWAAQGWRPDFYVICGAGVLAEQSSTDASWGSVEETGTLATVSAGLGLSSPEKGWDLRAIYAALPGTKNVAGVVFALVGYASTF